ncbi:hypothetical protein [Chryseolinea sp. H1M3-3]|uniref:hypothetical protein n=1 Tax=Chryseolinea sp. H1M3-3 TaxID=3034144 RepID=UPI0023ED1ADA|nr:hypothetical protein [Chryseolinea sp. H1M3-3]
MKISFQPILLCALVLAWGCGQKQQDHEAHSHSDEKGANQQLYDEVMSVHDEVMPKMDDLYKLKEHLKKQVADSPQMTEEKKKKIESAILQLDSASEGMMVWMRNFNPLPDSLGEEKARTYLEEQKVKVSKVKEDMLKAIEEGEALKE